MAALRTTLHLTAALVVCACGDRPAPAPPVGAAETGPPPAAVPGAGAALGPEDAIDALDLAVGPDGSTHLVWREVDRRPDGTGLPEYRVFYARGSGSPSGTGRAIAWGEPLPVPGREPARVVAPGDAPVLVAGPGLEPRTLDPASGTWRTFGSRGGPASGAPPPLAFDVASLETTPPRLGIVSVGRSGAGPERRFELRFEIRGAAAGASPPAPASTLLASRPASVFDQPPPRLLAAGESLHVVWAVNGEERRRVEHAGNVSETVAPTAAVLYLRSDDGGATWSEPVDLAAGGEARPQTVDSVEILPRLRGEDPGAGPLALFGAHGLYAVEVPAPESRRAPGRAPRKVSGGSGSGLSGGTGVRSLAAAGGMVAWIDDRYKESDRSLSKPLGGWPWSDAPDWADNDVLVLERERVAAALASGREPPPRRLTGELWFAEVLRARAAGDGALLVWAGRSRVGKSRSDAGEPPRLFTVLLEERPADR